MRAELPSLRSLLFVPGSRPERIEKARAAGSDAVCIDLEDAVAPADKSVARANVLAWLAEAGQGGPVTGVRVNGLRTATGLADLAAMAAASAKPGFLMLPKATHGEDPAIVAEALGDACPPLIPIVESATGLAHAREIAAAPRVAAILFGGADFSADIGASLAWEPMLFARASLVAACAAAGAQLLDVPYLDVNDDDGLLAETRRSKALGMTGRACIHPRQVAGVHAAFAPSEGEIAHARRVLDAFEAAKGGVALLDGKMIDLPLAIAARRVLARGA